MKKMYMLFLLFMIAAALPNQFAKAQVFEGKIDFTSIDDGDSSKLNFFLKNNQMRMMIPEENGIQAWFLIKDTTLTIVMDQMKMYMQASLNEAGGGSDSGAVPTLIRTGQTKEILGYTCELYTTVDEEGTTSETWVTDQLGRFFMPEGVGNNDIWKELFDGDFFPLYIHSKYKNGGTFEFIITAITPQQIPDSQFQIPNGYQKIDIPEGMQ